MTSPDKIKDWKELKKLVIDLVWSATDGGCKLTESSFNHFEEPLFEWTELESFVENIKKETIQARDREIIEKINGIKVVGMSLEECKCCFARNKALQDIITTLTGEDNE
jgi:hypothetical protein